MIEITFTEGALLIWAALATSAYLSTKSELGSAKRFIHHLIKDEDLRNDVIAKFKAHTEEMERTQ